MTNLSHHLTELPVLVLSPHNRCNCRCVMCDIWKIRQVREISEADLLLHVASLRALRVKWIVFSGGEPLMHSDLVSLCRLCRHENIRLTLLSTGLLLEKHAASIVEWLDDVIVSLDGPANTHDDIRAIPGACEQLQRGIAALRILRPDFPVLGRCTVQKKNCRNLRETVRMAHALNLNSISFLAVDVTSSAFNRSEPWHSHRQNEVALNAVEVELLEWEIEVLIHEFRDDVNSGFVVEHPEKLRRIATHFRAHLGQLPARAPRCNAPWVSAVVESDGAVRPCFFHPAFGNLKDGPLAEVLNNDKAIQFRRELNVGSNPTCRRCVCSLFLEPESIR